MCSPPPNMVADSATSDLPAFIASTMLISSVLITPLLLLLLYICAVVAAGSIHMTLEDILDIVHPQSEPRNAKGQDRPMTASDHLAGLWVMILYFALICVRWAEASSQDQQLHLFLTVGNYALAVLLGCVTILITGMVIEWFLWLGIKIYALTKFMGQLIMSPQSLIQKLELCMVKALQAFFDAIALTPEEERALQHFCEKLKSHVTDMKKYSQKANTFLTDAVREARFVDTYKKYQTNGCLALVKVGVLTPEDVETLKHIDMKVASAIEALREYVCGVLGTKAKAVAQSTTFVKESIGGDSVLYETAIDADAIADGANQKGRPVTEEVHEEDWEMIESGEEDGNWEWLERDPEKN